MKGIKVKYEKKAVAKFRQKLRDAMVSEQARHQEWVDKNYPTLLRLSKQVLERTESMNSVGIRTPYGDIRFTPIAFNDTDGLVTKVE